MINLVLRNGKLINLSIDNSIHQDCFNEVSSEISITSDDFDDEYSSVVNSKYQQLVDFGCCWIGDTFYDCDEEKIANAIISLSKEELIKIFEG